MIAIFILKAKIAVLGYILAAIVSVGGVALAILPSAFLSKEDREEDYNSLKSRCGYLLFAILGGAFFFILAYILDNWRY